jgi:hypothetical protein
MVAVVARLAGLGRLKERGPVVYRQVVMVG